jgi:uncharacterized membrane protein
MELKDFLDGLDHDRIVAAIRAAESRSRGEVRVHISHTEAEDARRAAALAFDRLGMAATRERNGVLVFVAPRSRRFAILGDVGIHGKCGDPVWEEIASAAAADFGSGDFTRAIVSAVGRVGDLLERHFPRVPGGSDRDELSDEVSTEG